MSRLVKHVQPYVRVARVDHWFKNIFLVPGMVSVLVLQPGGDAWVQLRLGVLAFLATCLVASSNYVLNEILDASTDRFHPSKRTRPMVAGSVHIPLVYGEWLVLAAVGFLMGWWISSTFVLALVTLWLMGLVYNVPPVRSKEIPYLDVLSESVNNPIRFLLGWYGIGGAGFPPSSFLLAFWLIGAYLMAAKRFSEYRTIGDPERAARYRASFRYYTEDRLAVAMLAYAAGFMFFFGVVLVKYHAEFVLASPLLVLYLAYYSTLAYRRDSVVQTPEKLYLDRMLISLTLALVAAIAVLAAVDVPGLEGLLGIEVAGW